MDLFTATELAAARAVMADQHCRSNAQGCCTRTGHLGTYVGEVCPHALQLAQAALRPGQQRERELLNMLTYLLGQYDRAVDIHARVVMDTPQDRALHDQAVATMREASTPARDLLARHQGERTTPGQSVQDGPAQTQPGCSCPPPASAQLDRTLCACGDMHFNCDTCGQRTDPCRLENGSTR